MTQVKKPLPHRALGDFQTPPSLAKQIVEYVFGQNRKWSRILEPTCGMGNFIDAVYAASTDIDEVVGIEIQSSYLDMLRARFPADEYVNLRLLHEDLFSLDLKTDIRWMSDGDLLILGNPPWVTNAAQGSLKSANLPKKTNLKKLQGLEAVTGAANFDICEAIILKMLRELSGVRLTLAMLCKTSVARNVISYAHQIKIPITSAKIIAVNAKRYFDAAVDACLLYIDVNESASTHYFADIYSDFDRSEPIQRMGIVDNILVSNVDSFAQISHAIKPSPFEWRQGIKHDAAGVMELSQIDSGTWLNKSGEIVDVEDDYIFPLLKSSDLQKQNPHELKRGVIITQHFVGEDTTTLEKNAPKLWNYLQANRTVFDQRKSSIYRGKPSFSIFGIGDYSFAPYKIMVSGLYKTPRFRLIPPLSEKPVLCDDTCYLLPFYSLEQAAVTTALFNHRLTKQLLSTLIFPDSKRPITKTVLSKIDVTALLPYISEAELYQLALKELANVNSQAQLPHRHDELCQLVNSNAPTQPFNLQLL